MSIRKFIKPGLIVLVSVFLGCETADDVGVSYPIDSNLDVKYKDFVLRSTNVYIDSLRTDLGSKILVGNYSNMITGSASAEGYFSLNYVNGSLPGDVIEDQYVYDSVRISIMSSESVKNDGGQAQQALIFSELEDTISQDLIYLSKIKKEKKRQIGESSFLVSNNSEVIYSNTLIDDSFGLNIYFKAKEATTLVSSSWPSLAISPASDSELVSCISLDNDTTRLYLYVTDPLGFTEIVGNDTIKKDTTYQAEFILSQINFSNVERDRTGSLFEGVIENADFDLPDGKSVIDPLAGISTAFAVDEIAEFFENEGEILINNANFLFEFEVIDERDTLTFFQSFFRKPNKGFFAPATANTETLVSNVIVNDNSFFGATISPAISGLSSNLVENSKATLLLQCTEFFKAIYEEYQGSEVLQFVSPFIEDPIPISEFILISQTDITLQRTIFKKDGIKLRLYYTELEN